MMLPLCIDFLFINSQNFLPAQQYNFTSGIRRNDLQFSG